MTVAAVPQSHPFPFEFPRPAHAPAAMHWDGTRFVDEAGRACDVLCYDDAASHWSEDLTALHEREAGRNHPIDVASRALALRSLKYFARNTRPVVLEVGCSSGY